MHTARKRKTQCVPSELGDKGLVAAYSSRPRNFASYSGDMGKTRVGPCRPNRGGGRCIRLTTLRITPAPAAHLPKRGSRADHARSTRDPVPSPRVRAYYSKAKVWALATLHDTQEKHKCSSGVGTTLARFISGSF